MSVTRTAAAAAVLIVTALAGPAAAADRVASFGRWVSPEQAAMEAAAVAEAQESFAPEWGAATSVYSVGACAAGSRDATHTYQAIDCGKVEPIPGGTSTAVGFPVNLPTGALITSVKMNYFDNHAGQPSVGFYRVSTTGGLSSIVGIAAPVFSGGNNSVTATANHTVQNLGASYQILAILNRSGATTNTGIYGFEISYTLQVSAPPAVATFPNDVPTTHPLFRFVEAMAASGLTGGCAAGSFCPDTPVTRGQLSVFLSVALGLHFPN
jgi:hypothetical protein